MFQNGDDYWQDEDEPDPYGDWPDEEDEYMQKRLG